MEGLPCVIPKLIVEVLNRLENDEDHQFCWKLSKSSEKFTLSISCKLDNSSVGAKTQNKDKVEKTGRIVENAVKRPRNKSSKPRVAENPVRRRRRKKKSPSKLRRSRERRKRFLERKKSSGKPGLASPEDNEVTAVRVEQDSVNSNSSRECAQELKTDSLSTGSDLDLTSRGQKSKESPASSPISEADLLQPFEEHKILREFLDTGDIDSDDDVPVNICSVCKHQPKKGEDLICCSRCRVTYYCSLTCQRKDEDFHRFACGVGSLQAGH